jgi:hypothetical protein
MADEWTRTQPCHDGFGRERDLRIYLPDGGRVGLHTPPGDVATIAISDVTQLQQHIAAAALEAIQRGSAVNIFADRYFQQTYTFADPNSAPRRVGVQARDGSVFVATPGWFKGAPGLVRDFAAGLSSAADAADRQQKMMGG